MFRGSIVALITPFCRGELDEESLMRLVEWHIEQGTHGIVTVGTTGENSTLTYGEQLRAIELVVKQAAGRIPVIAGAGSNNPVEAIANTRSAEELGVDGTLHVAGYYNRPNQEGLYHHFKVLHDATTKPIIIYNIPQRAIVDVQPGTLARLAELPRIAGIKDATASLERPWVERQVIKKPFAWLSGDDSTAVAYNLSGGQGCISVTANVAPKLVAEVQNLSLSGKWEQARELQDTLISLHQAMFLEPSPAGVKYALSLLGLCSEECRMPLMPLSEASRRQIRILMSKLSCNSCVQI